MRDGMSFVSQKYEKSAPCRSLPLWFDAKRYGLGSATIRFGPDL